MIFKRSQLLLFLYIGCSFSLKISTSVSILSEAKTLMTKSSFCNEFSSWSDRSDTVSQASFLLPSESNRLIHSCCFLWDFSLLNLLLFRDVTSRVIDLILALSLHDDLTNASLPFLAVLVVHDQPVDIKRAQLQILYPLDFLVILLWRSYRRALLLCRVVFFVYTQMFGKVCLPASLRTLA